MPLDSYRDKPFNQKMLHLSNRVSVLTTILQYEPISRVKITKLTGLNKSTVSTIINKFIEDGLICIQGPGENPIGRKSTNLRINERYAIIGAIDVGRSVTTLTICDLRGNVLKSKKTSTTRDASHLFSQVAKKLSRMIGQLSEPIVGVSVVVPGTVNSKTGVICRYRALGWNNVPVKQLIGKYLQTEILVDSRARAGARAEYCFGEARGLSHFVYLMVREGLGVGVILFKRMCYGTDCYGVAFSADDLLDKNSGDEYTGEHNLDYIASDLAVTRLYSLFSGTLHDDDIEGKMSRIISMAKKGDVHAVRALKETAKNLGQCIANINWSLNPERIIVGGRITQAWDLIRPGLDAGIDGMDPHGVFSTKGIVVPGSVINPSLVGARTLIIQLMLSNSESS